MASKTSKGRLTIADLNPKYQAMALAQLAKQPKAEPSPIVADKRIRQAGENVFDSKLEEEWYHELCRRYGADRVEPKGIVLRLADGCKFNPDIAVKSTKGVLLFEVKGAHAWDDSIVKVKTAARQWGWCGFRFFLVGKKGKTGPLTAQEVSAI